MKQELDWELSGLQFGKQAEVIRRTHPSTLKDRLRSFWNKELELPVIPLGTAIALLLTAVYLYHAVREPKQAPVSGEAKQRELIETGGSFYWKDEFERRLARIENPDQS
ncbi:hypothetical protein MUG84_02120 [Paenibacillus sp. KQZ6P-2]|uniref:Uncharacterized protein n=1 Tax=Paenibacillus mangrovi TaxID=2931978 RepID=A0A9X1WKS8_9BACL|nr:hypothetical protein [Paenibacillus mangrovi]MCJ8010536.1 hypothetical protein [Paenibacillus mangrovi]